MTVKDFGRLAQQNPEVVSVFKHFMLFCRVCHITWATRQANVVVWEFGSSCWWFRQSAHILGLASTVYCGLYSAWYCRHLRINVVGPPRSSEGQRVLPQAFFYSVEWAFNPQYSIFNSFTMTMENQQTKTDHFGTIYWNNSSFESSKWIFAFGGVWTLVVYLLPLQKNNLVTCQTNIVWVYYNMYW